jgi:hypothetical protein
MIIRINTDPKIEGYKRKMGLTGDVYIYNDVFIESLQSHKLLIPNSVVTTIEQAYEERVFWEEEQARIRAEEQERIREQMANELGGDISE